MNGPGNRNETEAERAARRARNAENRARREANRLQRAERKAQADALRKARHSGARPGDRIADGETPQEKPRPDRRRADKPRRDAAGDAAPQKAAPPEAPGTSLPGGGARRSGRSSPSAPDRQEAPDRQFPGTKDARGAEIRAVADDRRTGPAAVSREDNADSSTPPFNILAVVHSGRLEYEAMLLAASLRDNAPGFSGRLIMAEPQPEGAWDGCRTRIADSTRRVLEALGVEIVPLVARHFGAAYPQGNKIEALALLPPGPFLFLDTDTLVLGAVDRMDIDFARPSASMRREGTWPVPPPYGPGYAAIWRALYDRFGLDFGASLDRSQPDEHWERYLYFNAGWFFGKDAAAFHELFLRFATAIRDEPGDALAAQVLDPWLDQIALPLVISALGGGRPGPELAGLDGAVTCHWRELPLLYARESDAAVDALERAAARPEIRKLLSGWSAAQRLIHDGEGRRELRPRFDRAALPSREQAVRQAIKKAGFWLT